MNLKPGSHVHFIGICGTAMASLAGLMKDMGYTVTGSDQNVYPPMSTQLESLGIEIMQGYKKENLDPKPDLVIVGNVISKHFEEAEALLASDIPYTSLPKAMGEFVIADRNSVVMTGTHGKTTTTSMMATVAEACGKEAGYLVGGIPENFGKSFEVPKGNWFIIEGDEYDTAFFDKVPKFIHYKPKYVVLTSIEFDHADIYQSIDQIKAAFIELLKLIPEDGILLAAHGDKNIDDIISHAKCKVLRYGVSGGDYQIINREVVVGRNQFAIQYQGNNIADIAIKAPGEYNAMNATAVFALAREMGWELRGILQGLANFKGVKRRQQVLSTDNGITLIEDFAHHPTAVEKTIQAMREQYLADGKGKLIALFEPRSATSRRKVFQKDYVRAFKDVDAVLFPMPYDQTKISEDDRFSVDDLVNDLKAADVCAESFQDIDQMAARALEISEPGDVVLVMSNGAFGGIYQKLQG